MALPHHSHRVDPHRIDPYVVDIPQSALDDLAQRLDRTRWPDGLAGAGWQRGVPLAYLRELVRYWRDGYDWATAQSRLNHFPQFTTTIDGARIHFLHVASPEPGALPLLLTHGWPGSIVEFLDVIEPLADPRAHGGDLAQAYHVVVPSLPGYGLSGPVREPGWNAVRVAGAWAALMAALGYPRYVAQGGDIGSVIAFVLGAVDPDHVAGVHVNMLLTGPPDEARLVRFRRDLSGYMKLQSTRPQTLSYALTDSPVGQLAWIVEKFHDWTDPRSVLDRDRLLTNVMLYWLTATGGSSAHFYYEIADILPVAENPVAPAPSHVPLGVAVYPYDIFVPVRELAERTFTNIVHWREYDRGGHFAALEQPDLFVADLRSFAGALRQRGLA